MERLIRAYNERHAPPEDVLGDKVMLPRFPADTSSPGGGKAEPPESTFQHGDKGKGNGPDSAQNGGRFNPPPLTDTEVGLILDSCLVHEQRRRQFRTSVLEVCSEGEQLGHFDPLEDPCASFHVSTLASYVEVYGQDDSGSCLLAAFPLYSLREGDGLRMRLKSGQRLRLDMEGSEATEQFQISLTYKETLIVSFMQFLRRCCEQSASWLTVLHRRSWVPVGSISLILALLVSTAWLGMLKFSRPGQITQHSQGQPRGVEAPQMEEAKAAHVQLRFDESITDGDKRALLVKFSGQIVGGPSPNGFYIVEFPISEQTVENVLVILAKEARVKGAERVFLQP